ncbi:histone-lysine N-methyltransferase SETMAR [Trichonephila clavipes]|nr:histone-lysine N-methyltransferase SETMAR [Trichonephila clavipes]
MKTSSVEFISRSPTPSPMERNYRWFVLLRRIFEPWQWKRRKKRNRFEQTSRTLQRKISMRSTKDQLVKKDVLMPVKHNVFLWNLPDVEEVPSHDGETILLWSPWKYRCGQRTVRLAVCGSQSQAVFARRRSKSKLKLWDIRAELERRENARGFGWDVIGHPSYSPDLTPSDFHLFLHLKSFLAGKHFNNDKELKENGSNWLKTQAATFYEEGIEKLVPRYDTCQQNFGSYVER